MNIITKENIIGAIAVIALLGVFVLGASHSSSSQSPLLGTVGGSGGAGTVSPVTAYIYPNPTNLDYFRANAIEAEGQFLLGGFTAATAIDQVGTVSTCAASGTSTVFSVANPFAATTTADIYFPSVVGQATSTAFTVGTTTLPSGLGLTTVSNALLNGAVVATTTQVTFMSGVTTQLGSGQISAGASTIGRIVVGPSERIGGYATSTYGSAGALNYTPGVTSCTYKILWRL